MLEKRRGYKLKRLEINPLEATSLHSHRHRSEHWVVVSGQALVEIGASQMRLGAGQSVVVPKTVAHRITNPCDEPLIIIETQTGGRCEESDEIRIEDRYGRKSP